VIEKRNRLILTVLLFCWLFSANVVSEELKPFTSDGCSAFPDGNLKQKNLWQGCCLAHDLAYWKGGTYQERLQADRQLEACVESVGEPTIAKLMLAGVRVGGSPFWPTEFRWGYGWPYFRFYKAITEQEQKMINQLMDAGKVK